MGDTQSAQKDDGKDAAAEQGGTESDGVVTEQEADNQPLKSSGNFSDTTGNADGNVAACNGHFEDEIAAVDEDFPKVVESIKEEDTQSQKEEICQEYSSDEADSNKNAQEEISEMEEKQNDINETFRKLFSNIKFKLSVKRGSTDNVEVTTHLPEQDPKTSEDINDMVNETRNDNAEPTLDHNAAPEAHDTDSTTCPTLTDDTSDVLLESGGENSPGTKEDIEANSADAVTVFSSREEAEQKESSGERRHSTASPVHNKEEEVTNSPFKSFFTSGIFSGLQKKKKELGNKQEKEMEEITALALQDLEQEYEITVGVEACPNDLVENEPKEKIMCAPSPQLTDASPSISPSTCTAPVAEISSSQEDKVQASPLKRLLSGSSLKRLSRKPRSRRSSDGRLSTSGEHSSDHYLSSTESADSHNNENLTQSSSEALKEDTSAWESFKKRMTPKKRRRKSSLDNEETHLIDAKDKGPQGKKLGNSTEDIADLLLSSAEAADNQKEDSGAQVSTKASDEGSAWSSFKKLMTPKKLVKKPPSGNEEKLLLDETETKPSKDMPISDHSTEEEEEKRKESSVSWEAVLCGSGKKRSSKKSEIEKPQNDAGTNKDDSRGTKSALERSNEMNKPVSQPPNQAESFPECDEGLTWKSFKKLVTPKRRIKHEDEAKDYKELDSMSAQEETFSLRKLLSGKKISPCVEKQELSSEVDEESTSGDDEESETPAVVPLSEFDSIETDIPLQTQANIERCDKSEAGNEIKQDLCEETPVQIFPGNSETEIENVTKSESLPMESSIHPSLNEESDENTETSKHQQLSDIPEEGIITETMATPASVADEVTKDDTTAEDLIEITSEAITAPEPDDVSVTDETDMVSAVSQLPESSKTSGNTTPVPAEHQEKDTEMLLQEAAETIVTSTSAVQMCSEKTSPEGIVHSVWKQILKTFRNEKSKDDKTTIKMDQNEDAKDADVAAKSMIDMNKDISKEMISGVPTDKFDLAEIANDDGVRQRQEHYIESPIKRSEECHNFEKYLEEANSKTTSTEPSRQVEVVISDYTEVADQTEIQPSKTDSEKVQSAFAMTEETQDTLIKPKPQDMAETDTLILSDVNEEARMDTEEPSAQFDKRTELVSQINSREQTEAMKAKQEAENITEVMATSDMQAKVPNSEETNRQFSKTEIPTGEDVSNEDLPSTKCKPSAEPHTEMSTDNEDKEPSTDYEDFDKVQKERSEYENIPVLSVLEEKSSEDASPFQTTKNEDFEKNILSEEDMRPAYDFTRKPDKVVEDSKSLAEASVKHQVVLGDVADTTLDSKAVCGHLIETKAILEVISATETNKTEVHANVKAEDTFETGRDQETRVSEAGKESVLEIGACASHVIETKEIHEIISTAETSKNAMEALVKVNVKPDVTSAIRQTKEPEVSDDVGGSTFDSDSCTSIRIKEKDISEDMTATQTVKDETQNEPVRTVMSQDIIEDTTAFKKEEEKNETIGLHKSNDQVFGPESDHGRELPKEDTTFNLEEARFKLLEKEITPKAISDGDEKTPFTEDNIDSVETIEKQKVSETLPEISSHPEQIENAEVSEVIQTRVIVGDGRALEAEASDDLVGEFKRQNAGEQDASEAAVTAYVIDYEASELQHFKEDVISDTISPDFTVEDKTVPLTGGNDEQVNASERVIPTKTKNIQEIECKDVSILISDSDPNNLQKGKIEDLSETIQATQSADEMVALADGNVDPVRASKTEKVSILDLDQNSLQTIKNEELSDGRQGGEPADETVYLTDGNRQQVNTTKTQNVQSSEVCEPQLALISDSDPNGVQMVKDEEISEGIQVKLTNEIVALTDGSSKPTSVIKSKDVQEPGECEAVSVLTSDSGQSKLPNINNEDFSKVIQLAESADKTITLTDGTGQPESAFKTEERESADETGSVTDRKHEQVGSTKTKGVRKQNESKKDSAFILDSDPNNIQMVKNKDSREGIQAAEPADETITLTEGNSVQVIATNIEDIQEPKECEAAGETVSLTDIKDEQVISTKTKDVQEQNDRKEISVFVLDSDQNNLQMVKNKDFRDGIQAAEPANETISQIDDNGKPVIAPNNEEHQAPKEYEASHETVSLTDDKDEQVVSTKSNDVQEENKNKEISVLVLDLDLSNLQMVTNKDFKESIQVPEPANETISQTDDNGKPVITPNIKEPQEPQECEAPDETVSLTDGKEEQVGSTKRKDVQEQNESEEISVFVLHSDPKSENTFESTQSTEPADETVSLTEGNGGPVVAASIKDVQEPKECEAAGETVSLTDGKDEQVVSTKSDDIQEQNERKEISVFDLDSDPNNLQMVKNNDFRDGIQAAEPANETISQSDGNDKPVITPNIEELQEPKECEAAGETVSLIDGKDEQVVSSKTKDVQEQNESKEISVFVLHSDPNKLQNIFEGTHATQSADEIITLTDGNADPVRASETENVSNLDLDPNSLQTIKNEELPDSSQAGEPADKTISSTDDNCDPVIATNNEDVQEPKEIEAAGLTECDNEQVVSTKTKDVQEQNESKEILVFVLHSDSNKLQIVKSQNLVEGTQASQSADEIIALTDGNADPVRSSETENVSILDLDPNSLQTIKNEELPDSSQAGEPADKTISSTDGNGDPVIATNNEDHQEPKESKAAGLTVCDNEQVVSTKTKDVQEQNESKEISVLVLDLDRSNLQMVTNKDFRESIQVPEPANETIPQTDDNGKPVIAPNIEEHQEPKECEAPDETVSLTDGKDEQVGSTKRKDVKEQNESEEISVFVLHSDPKSENIFESTQSTEPADETVTLTEGNGGPVVAAYIKDGQEPKECETAGETVSLTDIKNEQVASTKSNDIQEQNESKEISVFVLHSDSNKLQIVKSQNLVEGIKATQSADEIIALTDGNADPVRASETEHVSILDLDPNSLQTIKNEELPDSSQAGEPADKTISSTDGNGDPVIATNNEDHQEPKEIEAAGLTECDNEQAISPKTKDVQEQNESKKVSALILDSEPNNLQMAERGNFFEGIQTIEAADETLSLNDGNGEPVISTETKDVQEQKGEEAVLALILDSRAKLQAIKNKGFREDMQASDQADQASALNEGNGEPVSVTTTKEIQEQEECRLLTTLILDSESNSLQVVKNDRFFDCIEETESAPERLIPTDGKGEFKSASEFKIVQEPGVFEDVPGFSQDCIQTVETVEETAETEPSTGNQLPIKPAEEPKQFKVALATISDSEPSLLLIPREGTEQDLSVIKNESKERPDNEPMNIMTEMFQIDQEVSTAKKENKDQPKDAILPCSKSNDDQVEPSKTEHVQDILEVPPAIISDLKAECSEFPEKDMILKDVTGGKMTSCDHAPFTEGSVQTPEHLKINIVQDQDIFKAVPVTILDLEPSSLQSVAMDQGSEDLPAEETLKSDLKEKTLSFLVDDVKPVKSPTVKDIEVVDVVEKATLKSQAITKYISLSKHELDIEPGSQDNPEPVEETTTGHVKEEHLVQEVDDLAAGLEVESYTLPKKREEPANLPGEVVIEELKENSSEIESFQEFSEAVETIKPNSESKIKSLKTKNTSQNNQEGQRSRDEIVQDETPTEIPIVSPSDESENLTKAEPNSTPTDAQLEETSAQETGQKKEALEMNQAQITEICSPDFKHKHEGEVQSAYTKQTLHTHYMPSLTDESNMSHVPENTASSEEIPEKCKDSGRGSTEMRNDRILSEIEISSDKEKENRPEVVRIKTAAVEPAEMPQYNTNDVIPDILIEKLSEIQFPLLAGITGETAFKEMMETVTPSAPEPITQTAEEVREMLMMHVQSTEFDDIQETQVQVKNIDTESAHTIFEPTLEVGFKESYYICQETIGEVETLSATSEMKDEVIHGENNATVEVVVVLTKDPPDVDYVETLRKLDTVTDVSDQVEDENKGVEAVVEDNKEMFTEMQTRKTDFKFNHEGEVQSAHTKQTLHTNYMPSFTDESNISHVPENTASSEDIPEKCKDSGRGSTEMRNDRILSEIEISSDKEKENRPEVVRIKTAAVEPAEMPPHNTNDVIPDTLIEKLSEIQLPLLAGITGETAFQEMMETVTPSAPEPITQTAEEVREMLMMHVQSTEFDDFQETQVQVKNIDTESAHTVFEPTLEVGFKESYYICQETIGEVETLSATSEMKDEVIHGENNATVEVVVVLTKDPPDVDYVETLRKLDAVTDVSDQVEDENKGVEAVVEDNKEMFTEMNSDKEKENRPEVVRIKTAAVEPAEMPQYNTNDVIPDTLIEKLSEIQLPLLAGITGETAFKETVTPSAPEPITQTAEEVREMLMMHVQSTEFDDIQETQVQVKNIDTESAHTVFEPTLEVGFKESNYICQETIGEVETLSATSEMKDEVIHGENNATVEVVVVLTKDPPDVDYFKTPQKLDTVTDVSDQVEDENKGVEAVVEDNKEMFIEINSDKEKENRPEVVRIKTAAVEPAEMPPHNTNDVIPDILIEKLSEIQLPLLAGITGETAFQEMMETVTPSAPEPITQTAEEVREMLMMHVQSTEFDDIQETQVQVKNIDTESAHTVFEPTLEVGFKESYYICQETIGEVETLSATSEMKDEVIHGENNATVEVVVVLTKDPPDVDYFKTPQKLDTVTDVGDQVEDENKGVEAVVEDNKEMFIEINSDKEKENRPEVVRIKTAAVEPAEMPPHNTNDVIPDILIEKLSEIQLPLLAGITGETAFQEMMETVTPSAPEPITQTAEEVREMLMMHVQSTEFDDIQETQVQVKNIDSESAHTVFEPTLEVGFKESYDICQETIGEVETLSATSEMKDEVIQGENNATVEVVVVLTKDPPDVDYFETPQKLDTLTDVGDQVEDENKGVEAVVEDNKEMFTEKPKDIVRTCETPESSDNFIHDEVLEETKAKKATYEVDASAEPTTCSSKETGTQLQRVDSSASHSVGSEVVSQNTGVIPTMGDIESKPSCSESSKPPSATETLRPLKIDEVSKSSVNTNDSDWLFKDTHTKECDQKAEQIEATVQKTDLGEQAENLQSTEKAMVTNQPQEVKGVAIQTEELKSTETPTLDVQDSDSMQRMSQREMTKEELIQLEHSWMCGGKAATHDHLGKEEDNDQDVWQDAMEDILTPEERDLAHSELQEKTEVESEMPLVCKMEDEETQEPTKTENKGDTGSEGEHFDVALEQLDISTCH